MPEFEIFTEDPSGGKAVKVPSKLADDEEKFYYEQSYKEPVEGIKRMEETAKFLVGAVTTASGLFMAAVKISLGDKAVVPWYGLLPFLLWVVSIMAFILVFYPKKYMSVPGDPVDYKNIVKTARAWKYRCLFVGALFFIFGIIASIPLFVSQAQP